MTYRFGRRTLVIIGLTILYTGGYTTMGIKSTEITLRTIPVILTVSSTYTQVRVSKVLHTLRLIRVFTILLCFTDCRACTGVWISRIKSFGLTLIWVRTRKRILNGYALKPRGAGSLSAGLTTVLIPAKILDTPILILTILDIISTLLIRVTGLTDHKPPLTYLPLAVTVVITCWIFIVAIGVVITGFTCNTLTLLHITYHIWRTLLIPLCTKVVLLNESIGRTGILNLLHI
jgi:hypothetical protein